MHMSSKPEFEMFGAAKKMMHEKLNPYIPKPLTLNLKPHSLNPTLDTKP